MTQQTREERGAERSAAVLNAAIECAMADGYQWITRDGVAQLAQCAAGTVSYTHGTMRELKRAVLKAAVEREILTIIAQGLADNHEIVRNIPPDLKSRALATL